MPSAAIFVAEIQNNNANQFKPPQKIGIYLFFPCSVIIQLIFSILVGEEMPVFNIYMHIYITNLSKGGKKKNLILRILFTCSRQKQKCNTIYLFFSEMAVQKIWLCTKYSIHSLIDSLIHSLIRQNKLSA
jgi:hypothetical protein